MPTQEWLAEYEKKRRFTRCPNDLNTYFSLDILAGRKLSTENLGSVSLPTGQILVRDPMTYLDEEEQPYFRTVPAGDYPVQACVVLPAGGGEAPRCAAVRVLFSEKHAVCFEEALLGDEDFSTFQEGDYFGVNVESGLACICDTAARDAFCAFAAGWMDAHSNEDLYSGYFAPLFAESYRLHPARQGKEGDWINWKIPGTDLSVPMFQSGFGSGTYPVYFGLDEAGEICQLAVQFIDVLLAFGDA